MVNIEQSCQGLSPHSKLNFYEKIAIECISIGYSFKSGSCLMSSSGLAYV